MIKEMYRWRYGLHSDGPFESVRAALKDFEAAREAHGWTGIRPEIQTMYVKVEVDDERREILPNEERLRNDTRTGW